MVSLSESYIKTLSLLEEGESAEASREFNRGFVPTVKKLYSEAATTYPTRFSRVDDWCAWTKQLYIFTRRAENAFRDGQTEEALEKLSSLREHFYALHVESQTQKSNDYIYDYLVKTRAEQPAVDELNSILILVGNAEPSAKASADLEAYEKARSTWSDRVAPLLEDGAIVPGEIEMLRQVTEEFYRDFGIQFE